MNPVASPSITSTRLVKWSYATRIVPNLPAREHDLEGRLVEPGRPPKAGDVVVAEVLEVGHNQRLELRDGRRATLFAGDLVGVVHAFVNPGRSSDGAEPAGIPVFSLLNAGGLCGEFLDSATGVARIADPTRLGLRGHLSLHSECIGLRQYGLGSAERSALQAKTIAVVGSGPESGKTTAASSLVHGLTRAGHRVAFGKPCGVASHRDASLMLDAGALYVLDFLDVGYPSTARCSPQEIAGIVDALHAALSAQRPDYVVLEFAEGLAQRETSLALDRVFARFPIVHTVYAAHDTLGVREGLARLRHLGARGMSVSGRVTCSPLALREAQEENEVPVLRAEELRERAFVERITHAAEAAVLVPLEGWPQIGSAP